MTRALALAALLLAAACAPEPHEAELPLRLRAQPADTLSPGDALRMTAYLRNPTRQPLRIEFDDECQVVIYVLAGDHTVLHPPGGGASCVGGPSELEIAPGDSVRFEDTWQATTYTAGLHIAYAVLWPYHVPREGEERVAREGHRSNVVLFQIRPRE